MIEIPDWFAASSMRVGALFAFMYLLSSCLEAIVRAARK